MIVAAAINHEGVTYSVPQPGRHVDVRSAMRRQGVDANAGECGFLDDAGRFLRRKPAALHATRCGQIARDKVNWNLGLYSEDVW